MNKTLNVFTNELVILYIEDVDLNIPVPAEMLPDPESSSTLRMWI